MGRLKPLLTTLAVTGALVGAGGAIANAASSTTSTSTSTSTSTTSTSESQASEVEPQQPAPPAGPLELIRVAPGWALLGLTGSVVATLASGRLGGGTVRWWLNPRIPPGGATNRIVLYVGMVVLA